MKHVRHQQQVLCGGERVRESVCVCERECVCVRVGNMLIISSKYVCEKV